MGRGHTLGVVSPLNDPMRQLGLSPIVPCLSPAVDADVPFDMVSLSQRCVLTRSYLSSEMTQRWSADVILVLFGF